MTYHFRHSIDVFQPPVVDTSKEKSMDAKGGIDTSGKTQVKLLHRHKMIKHFDNLATIWYKNVRRLQWKVKTQTV